MGLISKVLYLKETKDLIEDGLYNVGANITEYDTFRSYPDIVDDLYNSWPRVTATGESATLDQTMEAPLSIDLKGNTSQTGTPTPSSPIPVNVVSGDNEIDIVGKNLTNVNTYVSGFISSQGVYTNSGVSNFTIQNGNITFTTTANNRGACSDYIQIKPSTNYIMSYTKVETTPTYITRFCWYDKDKTFISREQQGTYLTSPSNAKYVRIFIEITTQTSGSVKDLLLEENTTATTYEPYTSQNYPLYLGTTELCKIGTYQDYIYKTDKWYLHKEIGKYVYNNDLAQNFNDSNAVQMLTPTLNITSSLPNLAGKAYCNILGATLSNYTGLAGTASLGRIRVQMAKTLVSTYDEFKAICSNNNLTIYYVLDTATDTEITNTTLINQLEALKGAMSYEGQTNISQVNNDLPFILSVEALKGSAE